MSIAKTAPRPTPDRPLRTFGDLLADSEGLLYYATGLPVILDGKHATVAAVEAEADEYATGDLAAFIE